MVGTFAQASAQSSGCARLEGGGRGGHGEREEEQQQTSMTTTTATITTKSLRALRKNPKKNNLEKTRELLKKWVGQF